MVHKQLTRLSKHSQPRTAPRSDAQLMCFLFSFFARVAFFAPLSFRCAFRSFLPGLDFFRPAEAALPSAMSMLLASPFFWIRMSRISRGALTMVFFALTMAFFFVPLPPRLAGAPFPIAEAWVGRRRGSQSGGNTRGESADKPCGYKVLLCMSSEGAKAASQPGCKSSQRRLTCWRPAAPEPAMMALRRLSLRAPKGVRQMSGHSIEEAIGA